MRNALRRNRYARQLDRGREQLAYLKFWQGVAVVSDISLLGWLLSGAVGTSASIVALAWVGLGVLTCATVRLHRRIDHYMQLIGSL
jgi:hypothetical protein